MCAMSRVHCVLSLCALHVCPPIFGCCIDAILFQSSSPDGATVAPVAAAILDNFRQADLSPDFPVSVATAGNVATVIGRWHEQL